MGQNWALAYNLSVGKFQQILAPTAKDIRKPLMLHNLAATVSNKKANF